MYATCRSIYDLDLGLETNKIQKEKRKKKKEKENKIKNAKLKNLAFFLIIIPKQQTTTKTQNTIVLY